MSNLPLIVFLICFVLMFVLRMPIPTGMIAACTMYFLTDGLVKGNSFIGMIMGQEGQLHLVAQKTIEAVFTNTTIIAVPLFVFAANVMNAGKIQHIGTPRDIYQRPANTFVATFIGRTNILDARMEQGALVFPNGERFTRDSWAQIPDGPVKVSVRPEEFVVHHADEKVEGISAVLEDSVYLGLNTHYYLKLSSGASVELIQESTIDEKLEPGSTVTLTLKNEKINIFSEDGAKNYLRG